MEELVHGETPDNCPICGRRFEQGEGVLLYIHYKVCQQNNVRRTGIIETSVDVS